MSKLKRKLQELLSDSTDEASRIMRMLEEKRSKGGKKRRDSTDDYNTESFIIDYIDLAEKKQKAYKFDDKGLSEGNYLDFDDALKNDEEDNIKCYFVKTNGKDNACDMLRGHSEVAIHFLCEINYDIGIKKKMTKDEPNLTLFTQKLISKYTNGIFMMLYLIMRFLTEF